MKKKIAIILLIAAICSSILTGCTEQYITKELGGDMTIYLDPGLKLEEITWKDEDSLWYLTRPMKEGEKAETHTFEESSAWGIIEGKVIIIEKEPDE